MTWYYFSIICADSFESGLDSGLGTLAFPERMVDRKEAYLVELDDVQLKNTWKSLMSCSDGEWGGHLSCPYMKKVWVG